MLEQAFSDVPGPNPYGVLTARELQVLEMASLGLTNWQIAASLHVTVHAIKFHLAAIYRKLKVTNRTEAAVLYLRSTRATEVPTSDGPIA